MSRVPCIMCGNPASRLAGLVHKPGTNEREVCCSKACAEEFRSEDPMDAPRYRVRYAPSSLHMGPWALIDTAKGDDHVAGRAMTEDDALRRAEARNAGEQEPAATPAEERVRPLTLLKYISPLRAVEGDEAA